MELQGLPNQTVLRSTTKYALASIVIDFTDGTDIYWARQQVNERLNQIWSNGSYKARFFVNYGPQDNDHRPQPVSEPIRHLSQSLDIGSLDSSSKHLDIGHLFHLLQ